MDLAATFERNWAKLYRIGPAEGFHPADVAAVRAANLPRLLETLATVQAAIPAQIKETRK